MVLILPSYQNTRLPEQQTIIENHISGLPVTRTVPKLNMMRRMNTGARSRLAFFPSVIAVAVYVSQSTAFLSPQLSTFNVNHASSDVTRRSAYRDDFIGGGHNHNYNNNDGNQRRKYPKMLPNGGRITMVGSGPGDPELLTISAYRILTDPSIICIVDRLVSEEILNLISTEDVRVAKKTPGCQHLAQDEIYDWMRDSVKSGRHVVRLKIGDPFVFGRGGEEVLWCRQEIGLEPEVIPGVSAAFSAPLLGGIPVTHRGVSNQVVMCTGYGKDNSSPDLIRYHAEQTVVFLMAVGRIEKLMTKLKEDAGYPSNTAVGIVERAGCVGSRTLVGTMENIAELASFHQIVAPSTIVVGEVVRVLIGDDEDPDTFDQGLLIEDGVGAEMESLDEEQMRQFLEPFLQKLTP